MPTATKLVSALYFAALAYVAAEVYKTGMPPDTGFGIMSVVCAGIGLLSGWFVMGGLSGAATYTIAASSGLRAMATTIFFALVLFSGREMIQRSLHLRYKDMFEALQAMMELMAGYAQVMAMPNFLAASIGGAIVGGILAEWVRRRWN